MTPRDDEKVNEAAEKLKMPEETLEDLETPDDQADDAKGGTGRIEFKT
jgi:hypothetical protein